MLGEGEDESLQHTINFLQKSQSSQQIASNNVSMSLVGSNLGLGAGLKQFLVKCESARVISGNAVKSNRIVSAEELQLTGGYSIQLMHERNKAELLGLLCAFKI